MKVILKNFSSTNRIFLGGTCNNSTWRDELIPELKIDYFNPIVDNWTPDCIEIEDNEKYNKCNIHLYVITSKMTGVYSIAEIMDSLFPVRNKKVFVVIMTEGFREDQIKSLRAVTKLATSHGALCYEDMDMIQLSKILNNL